MKSLFESSLEEITRLILIRHGHTNIDGFFNGISDIPLDNQGKREAELAAKKLEDFEISMLYSSPLPRAKQTADIIGERLGLEKKIIKELHEYDFGDISERTLEDIKAESEDLYFEIINWIEMGADGDMSRPKIKGAESITNFKRRLKQCKEKILEKHSGEVVAAVSHAGVIRGMLTLLLEGNFEKRLPFYTDNGSITIIDFYKEVPCIRLVNGREHLNKDLPYGKPLFL